MANIITRGLYWYLANFRFGQEATHNMRLRLYEYIASVPDGGVYDYLYANFTELTSCGGYTAGGKTLNQDGATSWNLPTVGSSTNGPTDTVDHQYVSYKTAQVWTFTEEVPDTSHIPLGYYMVVQVDSVWYLLWYELLTYPKAPMWNDTFTVTPRIDL
jgi:hypothetical protein